MNKPCFYQTLGVEQTVDGVSLKKAYRKLAMEHHPDRNNDCPESESRFKEVSEAYEVLKDDDKRAAYDRYGHSAFEGGGQQGGGFNSNFADVFDDFFGDFMGGGRRRQSSAQRGADLRYNLEVSLEEAFSGSEAKLEVPATHTCGSCDGSGAEEGSKPVVCGTCGGAGKQRTQQGFFVVERTCATCGGEGQVISDPCSECQGVGRVEKAKTLSVRIPVGVEDGTRIRLTGEGDAGLRGGPPGDLYIFINISAHDTFDRKGTTLYCKENVPLTTAILGGKISVEKLGGGSAEIKIPEGTQPGQSFRLKKKGMPQLNTGFIGDMVVEVNIEIPTSLSKAEKELVKSLAKEREKK
jgi:molecular chaperone DnaJ